MRSFPGLALFLLLLVGACSSDPEIPDWALATAEPTTDPDTAAAPAPAPSTSLDAVAAAETGNPSTPTSPTPTPRVTPSASPAVEAEVRTLSFAPGDSISFVTQDGDLSWSISVVATAAGDPVGITRVRAPDGETRYLVDAERDLLLVDDLHREVLVDTDAVGLYVSGTLDVPLPAGEWTVDLVGTVGDPLARVAIKSGSVSSPQVLDIDVWGVADVADIPDLQNAWRIQMSAVLNPHDISIGLLDLIPSGEGGSPFATLDVTDPDAIHRACDAAREATDTPPGSALVVLVDRIAGPDGRLDGVGPAPGTPYLGPASHACVAVSTGDGATQRGRVALHQILHQAGLPQHTTDRDGLTVDMLADTPECSLREADANADQMVSAEECADGGGSDNLMFWAPGGQSLTAEQAVRVRSHPLTHS